jgi:methyl-accepting chemotaxis protein
MKVAVILALVIASAYGADIPPFVCSSSSSFVCKFQEIGHNIKHHAAGLGDKLASVGMGILDAVVSTGTDLLIQGSKAVVGTLHGHLSDVGKRDLQVADKLNDIVQKAKQYLQNIGQNLKGDLKDTIAKLVSFAGDLGDLKLSDTFVDDVNTIVNAFKGKADNAFNLIKAGLSSGIKQLLAKAQEVLGTGKRGISDILAGAAASLSSALKGVTDALAPHVQTVVGQVSDLGKTLVGHATNLVNNVKDSLAQLSGKLSGHVSTLLDHGKTLVQHGKDALGAVKDAVADIAAQTLNNAKDSINGVVNTGKDALGVIVDHVSKGY